ncbi:MAG TPA: GNAT family N-acetyltransferase [Lacipirellulaceae bacterium]|jgi:ribosomal protein S18 acetylase RimI-like enzyme|nr:GNAT family N-acetyltransferase [Lacipirellulaceae bacterium]
MVNTNSLVVVPLTSSDIDDAQALVAEAGWNQTPADWRIFLELGRAFSARARDGTLVGTAATLPYAGGFGWISMLLVAKAWRRRGIGTRLLNRCVESLQELSSIPMLDATPAGRKVYRCLGFHDVWPITRWRRSAAVDFGKDATNVRPLEDRDSAEVAALDTATFGCNRDKLLERLRDRARGFACAAEMNGQVRGFLLGRNGRAATHFGPVVAEDEHTAAVLVDFAGRRVCSPVMLDVPDQHDVFAQWLENHGFVKERPLMRMIFSSDHSFGDPRRMIAIAGPELG